MPLVALGDISGPCDLWTRWKYGGTDTFQFHSEWSRVLVCQTGNETELTNSHEKGNPGVSHKQPRAKMQCFYAENVGRGRKRWNSCPSSRWFWERQRGGVDVLPTSISGLPGAKTHPDHVRSPAQEPEPSDRFNLFDIFTFTWLIAEVGPWVWCSFSSKSNTRLSLGLKTQATCSRFQPKSIQILNEGRITRWSGCLLSCPFASVRNPSWVRFYHNQRRIIWNTLRAIFEIWQFTRGETFHNVPFAISVRHHINVQDCKINCHCCCISEQMNGNRRSCLSYFWFETHRSPLTFDQDL